MVTRNYKIDDNGEARPFFDDGDPKLTYEEAWFMAAVGEKIKDIDRKEQMRNPRKIEQKKTVLTPAVIEGWVEEARQKKHARRRKYAAVAACLVLGCCGTASVVNSVIPDTVIAGKNPPKVTEEGNNVIVKPGQGEAGENLGVKKVIIDNWNRIDTIKKMYPDLLIPRYIPEGYTFQMLNIEATELVQTYSYTFVNGKEVLHIVQDLGTDVKLIKDYDRSIETDAGIEIRMKEDMGKNGFFLFNNSVCNIEIELSDAEFKKIADALER